MLLPSDADASGRRFGAEELDNVRAVLESGTLNCTRGTFVSRLEAEFAARYGGAGFQGTAVTSGTAAIHCALAALDLEIGDEVITTSVTDMGAITPILFCGAVPVFADLDARSFNVTVASIEAAATPRTRAVIATHLFGAPCPMDEIGALCRRNGWPLIEDAAQAPYATFEGARMGTIGDIGCFSLQQGKHFSCGEGGLVITQNPDLARRIRLFHDKAWGYGDDNPDHYFAAPNYRMTELAGAVALAQLDRVEGVVRDRQNSAPRLYRAYRRFAGSFCSTGARQSRKCFLENDAAHRTRRRRRAANRRALEGRIRHRLRAALRSKNRRSSARFCVTNGRWAVRVGRFKARSGPTEIRCLEPTKPCRKCWCCRGTKTTAPITSNISPMHCARLSRLEKQSHREHREELSAKSGQKDLFHPLCVFCGFPVFNP